MRTDPTPITLDLHVLMTGANNVRKSVVWFQLEVQSTTPWCVRIDALIHASGTPVNKR